MILTNAAERYISQNIHSAGYLLLSGAFSRNLRLAKKHLERIGSYGAIIHDLSEEAFDEILAAEYTEIRAGGGLVINKNDQVLLILRRGYWDLPKGKLDAGENIETCAVREVQEETGIQHIDLGAKIKTTHHIYEIENQCVLKATDWYLMKTNDTLLIPQIDEGIIMARWANKIEAAFLLKNSYPAIRTMVDEYFS